MVDPGGRDDRERGSDRMVAPMSAAEKLARHIWRLADKRARWSAPAADIHPDALRALDLLLEKGCNAIGTGDDGRMEAVGLELEALQ
jgi:hypothetical protein